MNNKVGTEINFIGDSHSVLTFGQTVLTKLQERFSVHFIAFSGMKLQDLADWPKNRAQLNIANFEKKPHSVGVFSKDPLSMGLSFHLINVDILIIALGTNDIVDCVRAGSTRLTILPTLQTLTAKSLVFIEPPLLQIDRDFVLRNQWKKDIESIGAKIAPCGGHIADQSDGIHMTKEMARSYGDFVSNELLKLI